MGPLSLAQAARAVSVAQQEQQHKSADIVIFGVKLHVYDPQLGQKCHKHR
jgi:hypothetical protein